MDGRKKQKIILVCMFLDLIMITSASMLYLWGPPEETGDRNGTLQVNRELCVQVAHMGAAAVEKAPYITDSLLANTALDQLGNKGGDKFWKWYGFKYHVPWCACFVSWCADQHGYIKEKKIPKFAYVPEGASWFKTRHRWKNSGAYMPHSGDLIFFRKKKDRSASHVGIVISVFDDRVYVVSGNQKNRCRTKDYKLNNYKILGYGLVDED
jgi:hypothetical protein